jgi:uncharacterized protein YutE (UPF0331/DUF86 family)
MDDPAKVEEILRQLKAFTGDLLRLKAFSKQEFLSDSLRVAAAKYLLLTSIECCLDIANHIIASEGFRAPANYADSFKVRHGEGGRAKRRIGETEKRRCCGFTVSP